MGPGHYTAMYTLLTTVCRDLFSYIQHDSLYLLQIANPTRLQYESQGLRKPEIPVGFSANPQTLSCLDTTYKHPVEGGNITFN